MNQDNFAKRRVPGTASYREVSAVAELLSCAVLAVVGIADALTGLEFSFALCYLGPVVIAAWFGRARSGYVMAFASGLVWHAAEFIGGRVYESPWAMPWNAGTRTAAFVFFAFVVSKLQRQLVDAEEALRTDPLTGLSNRCHVLERLEHDMLLMRRAGRPIVVAYFDLDDFKRVNDTHGHRAGDEVLERVACALKETLRESDTAARIAGDEFVVVLPMTDADTGHQLLATLLQRIQDAAGLGCSIGALVVERELSAADAIDCADRLMYVAKQQGKSQIVLDHQADDQHARRGATRVREPARPDARPNSPRLVKVD